MTADEVVKENGIVLLQYQDLVDGKDLTASIREAYGPDGLGILIIRGIPSFCDKRKRLLPLAYAFSQLPEEEKQKVVVPEAQCQIGWSRGAESLDGGVTHDWAKGSYYANPVYDRPTEDPAVIAANPTIAIPNVWPRESLPELEHAFKDLGGVISSTASLVAQQCDRYVAKLHQNFVSLASTLGESRGYKARLLYYYPSEQHTQMNDLWCTEHHDHGALTGLCSAMFFNSEGQIAEFPDQTAGLYIRDRHGHLVKGRIPEDCLAFQIGESAQILSGGMLRATPHLVRASQTCKTFGRATFACFTQPHWDAKMDAPEGVDAREVAVGQWRPGTTFAEFMQDTVNYTHGANYK